MPRLFAVALLVVLNVFVFGPRPAVAATPSSSKLIDIMVQLRGEPLAADSNLKVRDRATLNRFRLDATLPASRWYLQAVSNYQKQEIAFLRGRGLDLNIGHQFNILFNGFSATIPASQLDKVRAQPGVVAAYPQRHFYPLLDRSINLINVPQAWSALGGSAGAGRGIYIAEMDTGIDINSPCFSDKGMPAPPYGRRSDTPDNLKLTNNKVIVARAFGDQGQTYSAADSVGHGTFGGAIEACDYNTTTALGTHVSGVAPDAYLMNYNIFPQNANSVTEDPVLSALQAALLDGADVVNMSFGAPAGDPAFDAEADAITLAIKSGVNVVVSAGNAGPTPQSVSSPATTPDAIAVGATTNSRGIYASASVSGTDVPQALAHIKANQGSHPFTGKVGPAQMVYVGMARRPGDDTNNPQADDLAGKDLQGKIAVIDRGNIFFETKINNVAKMGAVGALIMDNQNELNLISMDVKTATLPAMFVSKQDGIALKAYLQQHPNAQMTLDSAVSSFDETPNILSDFSSRGYGADFSIKPDVVAPGQDIYAATENDIPNNDMYNPTGWVTEQGTSFSAPHVTGAVALILQKHPKWTPAQVKSALMNTATSSVSLDPGSTEQPSVMQVGAGLINAAGAVSAPALISPASVSFQQVSVAAGAASRDVTLTLSDVGGGAGTWQASVQQLHSTAGLALSVPATVSLPANGQSSVALHLGAAASTATGDYDGYVVLTRGSDTLRVPYFVHVVTLGVKPGSVLLVDATTTRFQPDPPNPPIKHVDVTKWYESTLDALHLPYTYWDEAVYGTPSLADMQKASSVIVYTGANFNGWAPQTTSEQTIEGPLSPNDINTLHQYMTKGGHLFVTGMGAALSDPVWSAVMLGGDPTSLSAFDNPSNDKNHTGGISPPKPSAVPDTRFQEPENTWLFGSMKAIDFSTGGDGAGDNLAAYSQTLDNSLGEPLIGVIGLAPVTGDLGGGIRAFGQAVLRASDLTTAGSAGGVDVGVVSSDEPTFKHKATFSGRSVLFSFGFEGINDNTGYATREQVLGRIFQWFTDKPSATVTVRSASAHRSTPLTARLATAEHLKAVQYQWQVGSQTLKSTTKPTNYTFPKAGKYRVRVRVTDSLGHAAVSGWTTVSVH